ncbi:MAG: (d)CMP kinase [Candidatus Caenarcaniphilales bacterium]|nr:(d)CMP kinase [Candidatus Caenarcaniphilales bacterium]
MEKDLTKLVIAIDGPAGSGKSTVGRIIAEKLGLTYIDTGAMYRAVTLLKIRNNISLEKNPDKLIELTNSMNLELLPAESINGSSDKFQKVILNGIEVSKEIRSKEVSQSVSEVSAIPEVRTKLVSLQQKMGEAGGVIMDGRDIGTTVFPKANLKIFLVASSEERAKRRLKQEAQIQSNAININEEDLKSVQKEIERRDEIDRNRKVSPLRQAEDAILIQTDKLSIDEVVQEIESLSKKTLTKI